jgi:hypothetical protein
MHRTALLLLALLPTMAIAQDKLWGPIDMKSWKATPCVSGRLATEQDVKGGRATFYIEGDRTTLKPIALLLPACAILREEKKETPVIVIQAEETPKSKTVGVRFLEGGNGVCMLEELELLAAPDARFK